MGAELCSPPVAFTVRKRPQAPRLWGRHSVPMGRVRKVCFGIDGETGQAQHFVDVWSPWMCVFCECDVWIFQCQCALLIWGVLQRRVYFVAGAVFL